MGKEKVYKGWEILYLIYDGKLKNGDKIRRVSGVKMDFVVGDGVNPSFESMLKDEFIIVKDCVTFQEAIERGNYIKHESFDEYQSTAKVLMLLAMMFKEDSKRLVSEKRWTYI